MKRYFHPEFTTDRTLEARSSFLPYSNGLVMVVQADGDVMAVLDSLIEGIPASSVEESNEQGGVSVTVEIPNLADTLLQVGSQEQRDPPCLQQAVEKWADWVDAAVALRMLAPTSVDVMWAKNAPAAGLKGLSEALLYQLAARSERLGATMSDLRAIGLLSPVRYDNDTVIELWTEFEAEVRATFKTNAQRVQTLRSENELLLLQILQLQEELEANYTEQKKLNVAHKTDAADLKEANERLQRNNANDALKLSEISARVKDSELEGELQLLQIAQLQEELEYYFIKAKEAEDTKAVYSEVETAPQLVDDACAY
ncbi:hypothetical protein N9N48_07740 [Luminiphilus sp.]|nr:hypothetical protein [Luminiphilus sp.]